MGTRRPASTQILAYFLLLLASQLYAYPSPKPRCPSYLSSNWEPSKKDDVGILSYSSTADNALDDQEMAEDFRRLSHEAEVHNIIQGAIENGDLLDRKSWDASQTPKRDTPKDARLSLKTRAVDSPQGQQGQRRLFGEQNAPSATGSVQSDGKIVFPTDDGMIGEPHKFSARPPPVCQGATFCERAAYYPENLINQAMELNDTLQFLAGVDVVSEIEQRIDVMDDVALCLSTEQVVYPKSAENKRKEWLFVVNQDNFKQGIRIETCRNENGECSVIDGLAEGYRTVCKQKYIYRQLAAISNDGKVAPDMFRFPSSCCCHIKFTGNPLTRIGLIGEQRSQTPVPKLRQRN